MRLKIAFISAQSVLGMVMGWVDAVPQMLWTLLALMGLDVGMGFLAAFNNKIASSNDMWVGLRRKMGVLLMVLGGHAMSDIAHFGFDPGIAVAAFYALRELVSLTENAGKLGLPLPPWLSEALTKLRDKPGDIPTRS